ncbi:histidine phosphatase family protein [Oscillatoria sp. CS-180]|uniref:histidine phosphatase family protein n=1 Tax=Oscillatoria sp. CS-180 TaxID=3021720 RepID=UPI00232A9656|nr:histidine phosphatase family protein [Oscillatoria sp. CS-180]MDB9529093.1 histidine phosphatase family protein [Oscillatoria sp. CS-180]
MKTRVILVRHGQSTYNLKKLIQGQLDLSVLTDFGIEQAKQVGQTLTGIPFDHIYASPLKRAYKTAETIVEVLRTEIPDTPLPEAIDMIKEIDLPLWEGLSFDQVKAKYPEMHVLWRNDPSNCKMTLEDGTEFYPVRSLYDRATQFWQTTLPKHVGQTLLVVGHSAINRALIATALGRGVAIHEQLGQANCAISVLNFTGELGAGVQVESMNLTTHMGEPLPEMRSRYKGPRMLLVRHGETEWNRQKRFQGQIDIPLNDNGKRQGGQAAEFLKDVTIDAAVSSSLSRPKETAEIILQHHPNVVLETTDGLKEIGHGEWEGLYEHEIESGYPGMLKQWQDTPKTVQMPGAGGENLAQVWERAIAAWNAIVAQYSGTGAPITVLVSAHDAVNKAILCHIVGLGPESFWNFKQGNGAVSVIDYPDGVESRPVLTAANITIHLSGSIFDKTAAGAL